MGIALVIALAGNVTAQELQPSETTERSPEVMAAVNTENAKCFACHSEVGAMLADPKVVDLKALSQSLIDPVALHSSNHAGMTCASCHVGSYEGYPHSGPLQQIPGRHETLQCAECHSLQTWRIEDQVAHGAHGKDPKVFERFTCSSCHDPHVFQSANRLKDPKLIIAQDNAMCLSCHENPDRFETFTAGILPRPTRPEINAIHEFLPNATRHWAAVRCIECHTPDSAAPTLAISHQILDAEDARRDCVSCHSVDTHLRSSLYRHAASLRGSEEAGFQNAELLSEAYVIGATRNTLIDRIGLAILVLVVLGVAAHGLGRIIMSRLSGGRK